MTKREFLKRLGEAEKLVANFSCVCPALHSAESLSTMSLFAIDFKPNNALLGDIYFGSSLSIENRETRLTALYLFREMALESGEYKAW